MDVVLTFCASCLAICQFTSLAKNLSSPKMMIFFRSSYGWLLALNGWIYKQRMEDENVQKENIQYCVSLFSFLILIIALISNVSTVILVGCRAGELSRELTAFLRNLEERTFVKVESPVFELERDDLGVAKALGYP